MKKILALLTSLSVNNIFVTSIVSCTFCSNNSKEVNLPNENIDSKPNEDSQDVKVSIDDETKDDKTIDNETKPYYEYTMLATGSGLFQFIKKVI
ncbi:hypothetical protein [Spiroplasma phoeniceum]|uniref:Lipoprotein n=1 Tax=Spiroplasma phoeniceum P40 TaxID=1276259 RepID=A0A345DP37_9MOLU|nr:hypothetical protein [Spiroplasma phoeniceum]AXF95975.1 hypothetical protein SDAV_00995 [Spiroplasma phoeniceum P40]